MRSDLVVHVDAVGVVALAAGGAAEHSALDTFPDAPANDAQRNAAHVRVAGTRDDRCAHVVVFVAVAGLDTAQRLATVPIFAVASDQRCGVVCRWNGI